MKEGGGGGNFFQKVPPPKKPLFLFPRPPPPPPPPKIDFRDGYIPFPEDEYDLISLFDSPALFTNERISDADIPQGLFCYHLRERDDGGGFGALEKSVYVNHGGSVITSEEIDFGGREFLPLDDDTAPLFTGEQITVEQYMNGEFEQEEGIRLE